MIPRTAETTLRELAKGALLDEAQRCPELFAWLQGVVDQHSARLTSSSRGRNSSG